MNQKNQASAPILWDYPQDLYKYWRISNWTIVALYIRDGQILQIVSKSGSFCASFINSLNTMTSNKINTKYVTKILNYQCDTKLQIPPSQWALMWHFIQNGSVFIRCRTMRGRIITLKMIPINFWLNSDLFFFKEEHLSSSKIDKVRAFQRKSLKYKT